MKKYEKEVLSLQSTKLEKKVSSFEWRVANWRRVGKESSSFKLEVVEREREL